MAYANLPSAYRFVDGYSRSAFASYRTRLGVNHGIFNSSMMMADRRDTLVTPGQSAKSYNRKPRLAGGRLTSAVDTHSRPTRFGGGRLNRGFGQLDIVGEGITAVTSLLGSGPADGSSQDPRIQLLNSAYNEALGGNTAGITYLNTWVNDQPPHPAYSNTYARQLIANLAARQQGATVIAATSANNSSNPPVPVSPSSPFASMMGGPGGTIFGMPPMVALVVLGGAAYLATRR